MPLTANSVNLAGQPSKVGGTVARAFGWAVLIGGWLIASLIALGLALAFGASALAPWLFSAPFAIAATIFGYLLLRGGRELKQSGTETAKATQTQAIFALASARGGILTVLDLARAINVTPAEADAILTGLAKESPDHITVDVDEQGTLLYRFPAIHWQAMPHMRVVTPDPATSVPTEQPARVASVEPAEPAAEPIDDEFAAEEPARQRAR